MAGSSDDARTDALLAKPDGLANTEDIEFSDYREPDADAPSAARPVRDGGKSK